MKGAKDKLLAVHQKENQDKRSRDHTLWKRYSIKFDNAKLILFNLYGKKEENLTCHFITFGYRMLKD